jgi:hypothetical protein
MRQNRAYWRGTQTPACSMTVVRESSLSLRQALLGNSPDAIVERHRSGLTGCGDLHQEPLLSR